VKFRELIAATAEAVTGDAEITSLAYDHRKVEPGALFFCFPGERADGHDFAPTAVEAGAAALVCERPLEPEVPQAIVADARAAMAPVAARFHGDPTARLKVAGITGTNGKTTTAFLLRGILEAAGMSCGLLGTVKSVIGGVEEEVVRTTPEAIDLQAAFGRMLAAGDAACAMEVSSHALALHRADAIHFDVAVFTNLTPEHLDFHADMEEYFAAKRTLFDRCPCAAVNLDDEWGKRLTREVRLSGVTYSAAGEAAADFRAEDVSFDARGSRFRLRTHEGETHDVSIPLPGEFNVANALAAISAAHVLGVDTATAVAALAGAERAPGRFEPITEGQPFAVLVDYAHTSDSLANVLRAARRLTSARLICVFGCGGDRDREKRPQMGAIAAELADLAIVTSDNPRSEDPLAIIEEIVAGIPGGAGAGGEGGEVRVEPDRRAAIAAGVAAACPGDTVVIAGKGHEQGQELAGGRKIPFDDREVAREELRGLVRSRRAVVDSRQAQPGDLFVGLPGEHADGGDFAGQALEAGAWGVLVDRPHADELEGAPGWVIAAEDPLAALQGLARERRRAMAPGAKVVGVTGSTGKTSVKDICAAILGDSVHASPENYNTEIGLPLAILAAPPETEAMVLEMAMRGPGQIAELCAIAEPDVGVITNVGPVHLELLGTVEAIAAAKAEILAGLVPGGTAVVPAGLDLLQPHLDATDVERISFGPGGDVSVVESRVTGGGTQALVATPAGEQRFELPFTAAHQLTNALAAIAAGVALGVSLATMSGRAARITFSRLRGELIELPGGAILVNDCYNANPISMRAAIDHLMSLAAERTIAVLGEMRELGPASAGFHTEIGEYARSAGVDTVIGVGAAAAAYEPDQLVADAGEAAELLAELAAPGDAVLVKGSRSVGLEAVAEALAEAPA
jgi:UDP-N-acetylmuramyl-tripeptide synthetase/UDP-N-acetylmuramoyl-tripeptide--D-alanyl-D-alanine ligase